MLLEYVTDFRMLAKIFTKILVAAFRIKIPLDPPDTEAVSCGFFLNLLF